MVNYKKCCATSGFNTKQVWVYDEEHDTYIDPPKEVLDRIEEQVVDWWDFSKKEELMEEEIATNPSWLQDEDYTYPAEDYEI